MDQIELTKAIHLKLWKDHPDKFLFGRDPISGKPNIFTIDQDDPSCPIKSMPPLIHLQATLMLIRQSPSPLVVIAKSRQVMMTWFLAAYHLWRAIFLPEQRIFFISKNESSATELVDRVKKIYLNLPPWLREAFPAAKPIKDMPAKRFELAHGSRIEALPRGAEQIRQHTSTGVFIDEAAFVPDLEETVAASLPAIARDAKIIVVSTAFKGCFFESLAYPQGRPLGDKTKQIGLTIAKAIKRIRRKAEGYPEVSDSAITVFRGLRIYENPQSPVLEIHYSCWDKAYERAQRLRDHLQESKFRREFEIDWESSGGNFIFRTLIEKRRHEIVRVTEPDPELPTFYGMDWGHAQPTCVLELQYDYESDTVTVLWELYQDGLYLHDLAAAIASRPLYNSPNCLGIFADPSIFHKRVPKSRRSSAGVGDALREEYGLRIIRAGVSPVERVQRILSRLAREESPGLIINPACDFLISELMNLRFDERRPDYPSPSTADHAFDALGYGLYAVRFQGQPVAESETSQPYSASVDGALTDGMATGVYYKILNELKESRSDNRFALRRWLSRRQLERRQPYGY